MILRVSKGETEIDIKDSDCQETDNGNEKPNKVQFED